MTLIRPTMLTGRHSVVIYSGYTCLGMKPIVFAAIAGAALFAQPPLDFLNHNRPVVDAHNCYPYEGRWTDRIDRALKSGFPVSIEQDLAWNEGRVVLSHEPKTSG